MANEWVNYGDVNPIEHGGFFVQKDGPEFPECYYVVEIIDMDGACGEEGHRIGHGYVDLNDWDDWSSVKDFIGYDDENPDPIALVQGAVQYYGVEEFGGSYVFTKTEEEAITELEEHGIEIKR